MKRRHFLATAGTVGIAGTVAAGSVVSSAYSSFSTSILLEEFEPEVKTVLDNFQAQMAMNVESMGLDQKHVAQNVLPTRIISKKSAKGVQTIVYKNKARKYVSLSTGKGVERIQVLDKI